MENASNRLSRQDFLRLVGASLGTLAASQVLGGCQDAAAPSPSPTTPLPAEPSPAVSTAAEAAVEPTAASPAETATPVPEPSPTAQSYYRPEIIRYYPAAPSKVVETHHSGVWSEKTLVPEVVRQMVDDSITRLTGLNDPREAWAALFRPDERIAIKVNVFRNSLIWTHLPLVLAVTASLQDIGVPAENITVFDYYTSELKTAGYPLNVDGPGVRFTGSDNNYSEDYTQVGDRRVKLSSILTGCDALINMPVLKTHMMAGVTFAMKNHYGSYLYSEMLHSNSMKEVADLNAIPEIKDRTRLIVGDALTGCVHYKNAFPYWDEDWTGDSILMSFDPVAVDSLALQKLSRLLEADGGNPDGIQRKAAPAFARAVELGLGTDDPANMQFEEVTLA